MTSMRLYEDDLERSQHTYTIEIIARDFGIPENEVNRHYEEVLGELKADARIKIFLAILAGRRVKEILLEKRFMFGKSGAYPHPNN